MTLLLQTTGAVIARAVLAQAARRVFGVMVRDLPEFDPAAFLDGLRLRPAGVSLRVAMPGYPASMGKALRDAARRAGLDAASFVTSVEGAERWRNDAAVLETIVVVAPKEIPKLNSLNRFRTLSGGELYRQLCEEGQDRLGVNEAQRQLWRAFLHKPVMKVVPLEGLLAYYAELRACAPDELPDRSRALLYLLGFLPDQDLFTAPSAARIAQRLVENQRVVDQLEVLSRADRQRISRALAARSGKAGSEALQAIYKQVMAFYREQDPARLQALTLRDVRRLLSAKPDARGDADDEEGATAPAGGGEEPPARAETRPAVRALDFLLVDDQESLTQLADAVSRAVQAESAEDDEADARDPETGAALEIRRAHPFQRLIERYIGPEMWGGVIDSPAETLDEALALLDRAEFRPFDPLGADWEVRRTLVQMVQDVELDPGLVGAFDDLVAARRILSRDAKELLLAPLVHLNRDKEYFATAERYLRAYEALTEGLKRSYEAIARVAPEGVEILCSQLLALDTIVFKTGAGLKAVLSPLHPLHLWKFIELSRQLRLQAGALTAAEQALLREKVEALPNFVTTLYLSNYITASGPRVLPEAGLRQGVPFFEELAHQYAGRDGIPELSRVVERFCVLYPHARLGLRLALIDPPDVEYLLKELVQLTERSPLALEGVHVRLFFTQHREAAVAALGGGAEDEEGAERFRGAGAASQFTLEVHDRPLAIGAIAEELARRPAHVAAYFDPSSAMTHRFARSPALTVHPLCLPMQFSFDRITKTVRVVPAADGGVFADHNDLRNRLSHQLTGSFFGVTAELRSEQRDLAHLARGCTWLIVADRAQEGALAFGVPRVALRRCDKRDVAVYAQDLQKFVGEFDRQLRRCNYTPSAAAVARLIGDLGTLLTDGLLALVSKTGAGAALDPRHTQGLLGTLVTSAWYRARHPRSLIVSVDSAEARRWLELNEDGARADLFGVVDEPDGAVTVDLLEVKTYQAPEDAYQISGDEIAGAAIEQLRNTARLVEEIFQLDPTRERVVSPQRREVLRQQLFRECFFEGRTDDEKQHWSDRLNELFALEPKIRLRLTLVVVGLTQARASSERVLRAGGREIRLVELTEEEVRRHVSDAGSPAPATRSIAPAPASQPAAATPPAPTPARPAAPVPLPAVGADPASAPPDEEERAAIAKQAAELRRILRDHGVSVQELDPERAQLGPSVVRFRVRLRAGAKVATLRARAEDIGRELASRTTPLIDNIAGENYVGIDLERARRRILPLLPAIEALPAAQGLQLPVAVGVTPAGDQVQLDLVQLPHLLVAGSTMSGKTVFLHAVLLSLIWRLPPERLELLLIDPKATDFVLYNGLPYLRGGRVFTEAEDAIVQLRALTDAELKERTRVLQQARCPNLAEYNAANPGAALRPIVVVIDEYADLIAVLPKRERQEFEREINRLAQRARSVGIHLVLATQRPTTDIVTGLLKANMPCRASFRLPQRVDSMTILDQPGAENLFGRGDMLLMQNDRLSRLQGYFMAPAEMAALLSRRFPGTGYAPPPAPEVDAPLDLTIDDRDAANREALVGEATGLAVGDGEGLLAGDVMTVEVETKPGEGVEVTGLSGEILRQSVTAAWRHVQQRAREYGIADKRMKGTGVSVHLVNISEYREGPSAGIPFVVAIVSALSGRPVRPGLAMTGEVSLKGKVGAVGGVPQKVVAAFKRGRREVILPEANADDLAAVPREVLDGLKIHRVADAHDAIRIALGESAK
jgi:hypothetical protein